MLPAASLVHDLTSMGVPPGEKVLRSLLVFAFLVVALRLGGKRELAQINVLDLAVLLLVSNALQNAMIGNDNSLTGGILGASALFAANYVFVRTTYRHAGIRRVLEGAPRILARDGTVDLAALRKEAIALSELRAVVLERGFAGLENTALVVLEPNGHIAVMGAATAASWTAEHTK